MRYSELIFLLYCLFFLRTSEGVLNKPKSGSNFLTTYNQQADITLHKVSLTQKGYIQFLRYIKHVPSLSQYTFCIWMRSSNLTYAHPLLSYSKNEAERLIRVWISPHGIYVNLEIMGVQIFEIPVYFEENRWYHICQSWSSEHSVWALYINGNLRMKGYGKKLKGAIISSGGDIVVGQEYTDFNNGLDDGVEGDIFGFNFVLSSTNDNLSGVVSYNPSRFTTHHNAKKINVFYDPSRQIQSNLGFDEIDKRSFRPRGLLLVELSYQCFLKKGAPLSGKDVLVSWTKTPVRVFGGAIVKTVKPFCS